MGGTLLVLGGAIPGRRPFRVPVQWRTQHIYAHTTYYISLPVAFVASTIPHHTVQGANLFPLEDVYAPGGQRHQTCKSRTTPVHNIAEPPIHDSRLRPPAFADLVNAIHSTYQGWSDTVQRPLFSRYEDLVNRTTGPATMLQLAAFLGFESTPERMVGAFRRRMSSVCVPYTVL